MPRSAIRTGRVDAVLPLADMPAALERFARHQPVAAPPDRRAIPGQPADVLTLVVRLVRDRTGHDFTLYKPGTLQRRIQRRMALAALQADRLDLYLARLQVDAEEVDALAKDLLIHVTSFFRDPKVFDVLGRTIAADLVRDRPLDEPIRIWVAGCSTGEEAYTIAVIFREAIAATGREIKLQVFASDVDSDAVATARDGLYAGDIAEVVSKARLDAFFTKDEHGYRVSPELRGCVVFTVQNVLVDPPFSRLDLISCRNLLIYLRPEAQARAVAMFHFALKPDGVLLLGSSEGVGRTDGRFSAISKPARLYRKTGHTRPGEAGFPTDGATVRSLVRAAPLVPGAGQPALADLCRRLVLENHAPAAVLINRARECLYSLGPTDRYLRVAAGAPSLDLLAMARHGIRARLASAVAQAFDQGSPVVVHSGPVTWEGRVHAFDIEARPVQFGGETLLLVCFLDTPRSIALVGKAHAAEDASLITELRSELESTRAELRSAVRSLEIATEEQTTINEEALSVSEEYQSTNEELLTSKEELQSLNEELNALNSQLQETLDRQRTTANDLQNILYSTDVATLFLDKALRIRFFTPATRALFNVIPGDVGRPLADLYSLAVDADLLPDAAAMLITLKPMAREVETGDGVWYLRRIMPYRAEGDSAEGVVITYLDITERKRAARGVEEARMSADIANRAKSRFLAAASHDLRQPLQTLTLIQGLLAKTIADPATHKLVRLQEQCINAMSGMLNTLLDINQIDAGIVHAEYVAFPVNTVFDHMRDEFGYHAQAKGLALRIVPCRLSIVSDPALLEQMIRNLIANAVKYTTKGRILVGCRRRGGKLSIEVLDTGIGMQRGELQTIFEEYHQIENVARERSRGLGLGLSIVKRLAGLLGHAIDVRSRPGRGSVFTIEVDLASAGTPAALQDGRPPKDDAQADAVRRKGALLVVEDDPEVRELLELALTDEGHTVRVAADAGAALSLVSDERLRPDAVLVDYNLPGGMTGLELAARLRQRFGQDSPVIVLTGDISTETLRGIAEARCIPLHKPVKPEVLSQVIQTLLRGPVASPTPPPPPREPGVTRPPTIYVVDDDSTVRQSLSAILEAEGMTVEAFADCEAFLAAERTEGQACLLLDAYLPGGMDGLELLDRLREAGDTLPVILVTGEADVRIAVQAMKAGAADFIEKPVTGRALIDSIAQVLEKAADSGKVTLAKTAAADQIGRLTSRQRQILDRVLLGQPSKNIAADLGISQRTVENHRAAIMHRTGAKSLPALARLALAAAVEPAADRGA